MQREFLLFSFQIIDGCMPFFSRNIEWFRVDYGLCLLPIVMWKCYDGTINGIFLLLFFIIFCMNVNRQWMTHNVRMRGEQRVNSQCEKVLWRTSGKEWTRTSSTSVTILSETPNNSVPSWISILQHFKSKRWAYYAIYTAWSASIWEYLFENCLHRMHSAHVTINVNIFLSVWYAFFFSLLLLLIHATAAAVASVAAAIVVVGIVEFPCYY